MNYAGKQGEDPWPTGDFFLEDQDWYNFADTFDVTVSCPQLAAEYNHILARGRSCFKFTCSNIANTDYEISLSAATNKPLPPLLR